MLIKPFASERSVYCSRNLANVAAKIKGELLIWRENRVRKLEKGERQTEGESLGSRALGLWQRGRNRRTRDHDVSRVQTVKQNSPRVGGFSWSISPSLYRSLALFVSLVSFPQASDSGTFWCSCKSPGDSGLLVPCAGVSGRSAWWLCNLTSGLFPPSALFFDYLRGAGGSYIRNSRTDCGIQNRTRGLANGIGGWGRWGREKWN